MEGHDGCTGAMEWEFDDDPSLAVVDEAAVPFDRIGRVCSANATQAARQHTGETPDHGSAGGSEACYLRGTRILTPTGEALAENLRVGDLLVTRFNGLQAITGIGRRIGDVRMARDRRETRPVCIHAGALAAQMPARNLHVSPGQCLLIGGKLLRAGDLVNGITITQDHVPAQIDYISIGLATHDCLISEGAFSATSALDQGGGWDIPSAEDIAALGQDEGAPAPCPERIEAGAALEHALRPIVAHAAAGLKPGPLRGYIDTVEAPWTINGWAQDSAYPELPVLLEIVLDGRVVGTALACTGRADLKEAGIGQGRAAFNFTMPFPLDADGAAQICVRRFSDGAALAMSQECFAQLFQREQEVLF